MAATPPGRFLIGWMLAHMTFALPVKRLRETSNLLAFHHPAPVYPFHALIVPKKPVASLAKLEPDDTAFLTDLFATVQSLVQEFNLAEGGYRLIVNGGAYQDFPQLHFHLVSDLSNSAD